MQLRSLPALLLSALAIIAADLAAEPIDFTFGIASGVLYVPFHQGETLRDGLEITTPFPDYVQNKSYSAQIVGLSSNERNEAFVGCLTPKERASLESIMNKLANEARSFIQREKNVR